MKNEIAKIVAELENTNTEMANLRAFVARAYTGVMEGAPNHGPELELLFEKIQSLKSDLAEAAGEALKTRRRSTVERWVGSDWIDLDHYEATSKY